MTINKEKNKLKFKLAKSIIFGLLIPSVCIWLIIDDISKKNLVNEYLLITKDKVVTRGTIVKAEEFTEEIESDNGRTVKVTEVSGFLFDYTFNLPNGEKITSKGGDYGELPLEKKLDDIPYEIEVEYISNNPNVNRIKGLLSNHESLWELFRRKLLFSLLIFLFCSYIGFVTIKDGIKKYKTELHKNLPQSANVKVVIE